MSQFLDRPIALSLQLFGVLRTIPAWLLVVNIVALLLLSSLFLYCLLVVLAPTPRNPYSSEKSYITTSPGGGTTPPLPLPSWHDTWLEGQGRGTTVLEEAEVAMSVVIPAYNEEERLEGMLEEAIAYLDTEYGRVSAPSPPRSSKSSKQLPINGSLRHRGSSTTNSTSRPAGYEIILVNDGSTDATVSVAIRLAHKHSLHDILRIITLKQNRGKGGAVTHGFRHVRGQHAVFADADGASRFGDLRKLMKGCEDVEDGVGRGVAVGSRAHMVGSEAVIKPGKKSQANTPPPKRSPLRNALMHAFHFLLRLLTPPATSRIKDTQCGFKLFSRASLPYIIPYMHAEGWIFDVEMLMLAESAPPVAVVAQAEEGEAEQNGGANGSLNGDMDEKLPNLIGVKVKNPPGIKVAEVPIGWQEVGGSKLNVVWDSLGMAVGLAVLRLSWGLGVYSRVLRTKK